MSGSKWGAPHIHAHVCAYMHTYMLKIHVKKLQMANNMFIMINVCVCVHASVQICVHT